MKVISLTAYRRYGYFRRVLESLARCDGIDEYVVLIHIDPGFIAVEELAKHFPFPRKEVVINPFRLGCNGNIGTACRHGFSEGEYVVVVEDDIVLAPDAIRFFEHVDKTYRGDPECFGGCAYHKLMPPEAEFHQTTRERWFTPWGWSTWRDRWSEIEKNWPRANRPVWDGVANKTRCRGEEPGDQIGRYVVYPKLARSQNIGAKNGTFCKEEHHAEHQFNRNFAGNMAIGPAQFHA